MVIISHPECEKQACFHRGFDNHRSPPVSTFRVRMTDYDRIRNCARNIDGGRNITGVHVNNTLGYGPCESLISATFSHSRDVRTPLCAPSALIKGEPGITTTLRRGPLHRGYTEG